MSSRQVLLLQAGLALLLMAGVALGVGSSVGAAGRRLAAGPEAPSAAPAPVVAGMAEVDYCSDQMKTVLRRVLTSCGLLGAGRRGCQPGELRAVAQIGDDDFNALFSPLGERGGVLLFDLGKHELDAGAAELLERLWTERGGASYFFLVGRASTDGAAAANQALSHRRVNSALFHLQERFKDPELEQKVGLLWLGEEYAQLGTDFCRWSNSRPGAECSPETINRSVIVSWIDCRL